MEAGATPKVRAAAQLTRRVVIQHHALVRFTHWLNVPLLAGLIVSGLSIYWASPVLTHPPDPKADNTDYIGDLGIWAVRHVPGLRAEPSPASWVYNQASLGTFRLAQALRLHWFFAYLFMANGLLYLIGLALGGGYKALLPRLSDPREAFRMIRYYLGVLPAWLLRRRWPHPPATAKYNALQRGAYFSIPVLGALAVASGWAIHKPAQLPVLERLFAGYDAARIWHFWIMCALAAFVIPHVVLVLADGWDTLRSMVVGWSARTGGRARGEE